MKQLKTTFEWLNKIFFIAVPIICICCLAFYLFTFNREGNRQPTVNKIQKVDGKYELSDTLFYCDEFYKQNHKYFSVYKIDSTETLNREDICHRCGKDFSEHGNIQMWATKTLIMQERE